MQVQVGDLPAEPLAAAARFHAEVPGRVAEALERTGSVVLVFAPADHAHRAWRLAAVQELARKFAPARLNAVGSDDEAAIRAAEHYLAAASGVTGQYFTLDGHGAQ